MTDVKCKFKLTPTLYNSWFYWTHVASCQNDFIAEKAFQDFMNTLSRTKTKPTPAQLAGLKYEKAIQKLAERFELHKLSQFSDDDEIEKLIEANRIKVDDIVSDVGWDFNWNDYNIVKHLTHCIWQCDCKREIVVNDIAFSLYGRIDAFSPIEGTLFDLKLRTLSDKTPHNCFDDYYYSLQHLVYMYCMEMNDFTYIIKKRIKDRKDGGVSFSNYTYSNKTILQMLRQRIGDFYVCLLSEPSLLRIFVDKWSVTP